MIVGIASKNENRTASFGSHPNMLAHDIVDALLEIPGIKAADCIVPINKASRIGRPVVLIRTFWPNIKIAPVTIKQIPKYCGSERILRKGARRK